VKKLILILAVSVPLFANPKLFSKYEATRQALLTTSLPATQKAAAELATAGREAKNVLVTQHADAVAKSKSIEKAREHFGAVSKAMLEVHGAAGKNARPAVYSCPMVKKSWLQPKGKVGNPYDAAMAMCGVMEKE
jgi:hypothetical protein